MKKSYSIIGCVAMFLLSLVLCCKPVKAAEPKVINLSDLESDSFYLSEDCVLNLDTDRSLYSIDVNCYELTITGNGTLKCNNVSVHDPGKLITDRGTIYVSRGIGGDGTLVVNDGYINAESINVYHIIVNGGHISTEISDVPSRSESYIRIYGGHMELTRSLKKKEIYIDDNMFVTEPWNKEPEPDYDGQPILKNGKFGVKLMPKSEVVFIEEMTLNETSCSLEPGEKIQLSASVLPENASNKRVSWSSSDSSIAAVDSITGEVKALRPGKAVITASAQGGEITQTCEITVEDTKIYPDGLVIEASNFVHNVNTDQPYIKVKYNGVELKEGSDYVINKEFNDATGMAVTTITGLDEYIRNISK